MNPHIAVRRMDDHPTMISLPSSPDYACPEGSGWKICSERLEWECEQRKKRERHWEQIRGEARICAAAAAVVVDVVVVFVAVPESQQTFDQLTV